MPQRKRSLESLQNCSNILPTVYPLSECPEIGPQGGWLITRCLRLLIREQHVFLIVSDC